MRRPVVLLLVALGGIAWAEDLTLVSGSAQLAFSRDASGMWFPTATACGRVFGKDAFREMIRVETDEGEGRVEACGYDEVRKKGGRIGGRARMRISNETLLTVTDIWTASGNGAFDVRRRVEVRRTDGGGEPGYFTSFLLTESTTPFAVAEPFVPSVLYKNTLVDPRARSEGATLDLDHREFNFREDRLPLPVALYRAPGDGFTASVILHETGNRTVLADSKGVRTHAGYRFGGVGFTRRADSAFAMAVSYPGDDRRAGGLGRRFHPMADGQKDEYGFRLGFSRTPTYGAAVEAAWRAAIGVYRPKVRGTDPHAARKGLLDTLYSYRQSPDGDQDLITSRAHRPGFPWGVYLQDGKGVNDSTYEIGFVGAQTVAAYALLQAGVLERNAGWRKHGEAVIDFWAKEGLTELGYPKSRYYPIRGEWDPCPVALRQAATGMCGVFDAWNFLHRRGEERPAWLDACTRFGAWLLAHQSADGSWAMEYKAQEVVNGEHPVSRDCKTLTICAVPYLARLFEATGDGRYRTGAMKAAEFCHRWIHEDYLYVGCVIDNRESQDSESGYEAIKGFLAAHELDPKNPKWLAAARQAAIYAETWVYLHEIPPEDDARPPTDWPFDRSVVGQHMLTVNQPAADLGFAWTAYWYHRLYKLTKDEHYLLMSRIALHNVKQSMNLGGKLYPGMGEGLQQEACTLRTGWDCPRRTHSIMEALTWNFAAHLQPYCQFLESTGRICPPELCIQAPSGSHKQIEEEITDESLDCHQVMNGYSN